MTKVDAMYEAEYLSLRHCCFALLLHSPALLLITALSTHQVRERQITMAKVIQKLLISFDSTTSATAVTSLCRH